MNQRQQQTIEFQNAQTEALLQQFGRQRLLLNDDECNWVKPKTDAIGRKND